MISIMKESLTWPPTEALGYTGSQKGSVFCSMVCHTTVIRGSLETLRSPPPNPQVTNNSQLLGAPYRYLQEVGYTDTILDVKSQRVKALLGLAGDEGQRAAERSPEAMVNGSEPALKSGVGTG